ncbi:SOS response-associated peptidase [Flavobacterium sp. ASW18X]|uniref:SOS response-associated peptidase n=1 Tax=Flavobacterium sp. ASW18X TaxID=2572595 RepID=UPI0010AE91FB|nr:SOS response-associated peptidase [Flavobacterium sp. ASW18X]TKD58942.1 SOS response-associated peptidase [Flavobacterium sp. ASW18X]
MCYDVKAQLKTQLKRAKRHGDSTAIQEIEEKLAPLTDLPLYHASGFQHPKLFIYPTETPYLPVIATWGLIPHWVTSIEQKNQLWNKTINARGETLLEKASFRVPALRQRCLVYVDGFYEHHHLNKHAYPFYISLKNKQAMCFAGVYDVWRNPNTFEESTSFAIVTTKGNSLLQRIHNNPKVSGPRMPLILSEKKAEAWLKDEDERLMEGKIATLLDPIPEDELVYHSVAKLRGKGYVGNIPTISDAVDYPELALAFL